MPRDAETVSVAVTATCTVIQCINEGRTIASSTLRKIARATGEPVAGFANRPRSGYSCPPAPPGRRDAMRYLVSVLDDLILELEDIDGN